MASIEIPERTFKRLQALAVPFVDTPVTVIDRLLDAHENKPRFDKESYQRPLNSTIVTLSPSELPDLTDTRIVKAEFGGIDVSTPYWNDLVRKVHEIAFKRLGGFEALRRMTTANIDEDLRTDKGYKPINGTGLSIQGVDSNEAWRIVYSLARKLNCPIALEIDWRLTTRSERPGESARIVWKP